MDLLQGYGSDDSSSSVESGPSPTALKSPSTANTIATTSNAQITGYENAKLPRTSTSTSASTLAPGRKSITNKKKGRRILKLNSVLPPDILERLTRSTVQSGGGSGTYDDDSTDDDDDDDDNDNDNVTKKQKSPTKNKIKKTFGKSQNNLGLGGASGATGSGDLGLDSLLSDLQSFIPTEGNKKKKIISKMKNTGNSHNNNNNDSGDKKGNDNGKMGFAFMNVSKTVIQRKKHDPINVVDIHATSKPTTVEDASSEDDSGDDDNNDDNVDNNDAIPMFSSAQHVNVNENSKQKSIQSESTSSLSRRNNSVGAIKRPRRAVTAAPTVPSSFQSVKIPNQTRDMGMEMDMNSDFPSSSTNNMQHQQQYQQQTINDTNNDPSMRQTSKMSKRELEKALRTGNFDAIDSSNITQNIDTSNYMAPNEDDLLATASTSNPAASQYNTAKLQMYAPSEGTSVAMSEVTAKQRGKHQIHSLVANARKLEADRARLSAMGLGGRKSTRADAKRKYGW